MKEELQDQKFNKLIEVLLLDLAFYIPEGIINASLLKQLEAHIPERFFNELSILDPRGFGEFEIEEINDRLQKKRIKLEKNIFILINLHIEQKEQAFDYMFYKYLDQLVFYRSIANWLFGNLEHFFKDEIDFVTKGVFGLQLQLYHNHLIELIQEFHQTHQIELKEVFSVEELLLEYIPEMVSRYGLTSFEETNLKKEENTQIEEASTKEKKVKKETTSKEVGPTSNRPNKTKETKEKKPKPDINEQDIEDFLFKTVFGVQLTK
jgi:hypothetical protein